MIKESPDTVMDPNDTNVKRTETKKVFKCDHCPKSFMSKSSLQAHVRVHTGTFYSYSNKVEFKIQPKKIIIFTVLAPGIIFFV